MQKFIKKLFGTEDTGHQVILVLVPSPGLPPRTPIAAEDGGLA